MSIREKIEKLEKQGWSYEKNYNTGSHSLSEALVKRFTENNKGGFKTLIKSIENGRITNYSK